MSELDVNAACHGPLPVANYVCCGFDSANKQEVNDFQ